MNATDAFQQHESQVRSYCRAFPCTLDVARGTELWDANGVRYIDFLAGAGSLNYGHNNPILKQALLSYIERDAITHSLDLHTAAKEAFLTAMNKHIMAPRGLDHRVMFPGPTGTNAVEAAFKIARKVTGRQNIVSFTNGYHGMTLGALAATGNSYNRAGAGIMLPGTSVVPYDGYLGESIDTMDIFEKMLDDPSSGLDLPAAVIVETVQGEGGLKAAGFEWLKRLRAITEKRDILLIVDDIQAGCGRTGTFFSCEPAEIVPDIITVSKSISGYGVPFALVLIRPQFDQWGPGEHNGTFRGNNHAFVTAVAALETYWADDAFAASVREKGEYLANRFKGLQERFPTHIVEVRGRGMMRGLRCADPKKAAEITKEAFQHNLIIERSGPHDEVIKCLAPLTTDMSILDEGLAILERSMEAVFGS